MFPKIGSYLALEIDEYKTQTSFLELVNATPTFQAGSYSIPILGDQVIVAETESTGNYLSFSTLPSINTIFPTLISGESMVYGRNLGGLIMSKIIMMSNGVVAVNDATDNAVLHSFLDTAMQTLVSAINAELVKIQTGIAGAGGSYTPATLSLDLSTAKSLKFKLS